MDSLDSFTEGALDDKLRQIRREIRDEYSQEHDKPWIVGYSGGKDSSLLLQLVVEAMLSLPPTERKRPLFILFNDTLVESPVFQEFSRNTLRRIEDGVRVYNLPIKVISTAPDYGESFWVNLLGKGYPAPNPFFRWCMDRLKIQPTKKFIQEQVSASGKAILLLGIRRAESAARQQRIDRYLEQDDGNRLSPNNDIPGCYIFRPLLHLTTNEVWNALDSYPPPWGERTTENLFDIYRDAGLCNATSGCPSDDEIALKDSESVVARFGCWTCTVVEKDRSLAALVESGYPHLQPLAEYRERLKEVSRNPELRSKVRRNGRPGLGL